MKFRGYTVLFLFALVSACGGGSGSSDNGTASQEAEEIDGDTATETTPETTPETSADSVVNSPLTGDPNLVIDCGLELPCSWVTQDDKFRVCLVGGNNIQGAVYRRSGFLGPEELILDTSSVSATDSSNRRYVHDEGNVAGSITEVSVVTSGDGSNFRVNMRNAEDGSPPRIDFYSSVNLPITSSVGTFYNVRFLNVPEDQIAIVPCRLDIVGTPEFLNSYFPERAGSSWNCRSSARNSPSIQLRFETDMTGSIGLDFSGAVGFNWEFSERLLTATLESGDMAFFLRDIRRNGDDQFDASFSDGSENLPYTCFR